jgi:hypothetical protein
MAADSTVSLVAKMEPRVLYFLASFRTLMAMKANYFSHLKKPHLVRALKPAGMEQ